MSPGNAYRFPPQLLTIASEKDPMAKSRFSKAANAPRLFFHGLHLLQSAGQRAKKTLVLFPVLAGRKFFRSSNVRNIKKNLHPGGIYLRRLFSSHIKCLIGAATLGMIYKL